MNFVMYQSSCNAIWCSKFLQFGSYWQMTREMTKLSSSTTIWFILADDQTTSN